MIISLTQELECLLCGHGHVTGSQLCHSCSDSLPYTVRPCQRCAIELFIEDEDQALCGQCISQPPHYDYSISAVRYRFPIPSLVARYKDQGHFAEGSLLASLLTRAIEERLDTQQYPTLIISVPLHTRRLQRRGFNQSEILTRSIAKNTGIGIGTKTCRRVLNTPAQRGLDSSRRKTNLNRAFEISANARAKIESQHIAIVDDVVTTGSTVNALAKALKCAGATKVGVLCVARVEKPNF